MITFHVEPWSRFRTEGVQLWKDHWAEVAVDRDEIKLDVDFAQYDAQDAAGALHIVVARDEGRIVGYWSGLIRGHLHYGSTLHAFTDVYFVEKAYRKEGLGVALFSFVEKSLKARGVKKIVTATKVHLNHSALFKGLGYRETEIVFTKLLEG